MLITYICILAYNMVFMWSNHVTWQSYFYGKAHKLLIFQKNVGECDFEISNFLCFYFNRRKEIYPRFLVFCSLTSLTPPLKYFCVLPSFLVFFATTHSNENSISFCNFATFRRDLFVIRHGKSISNFLSIFFHVKSLLRLVNILQFLNVFLKLVMIM